MDSARELDAEDLFDLEKRPKKRETAEDVWTATASDDRVEASVFEVVEISARADIVADRVVSVRVLGATEMLLSASVLACEVVLVRGEMIVGVVPRVGEGESEEVVDVVFRLKKDRRPPEAFFFLSVVDCCGPGFSCETIRQPEGATSTSGT